MRLQGKISELRDADFKLVAADGSDTPVRYVKPVSTDFKNGDEVVVTGNNQTDPPFLAETLTKVPTGRPASHVLLYVAITAVILIAAGVIYALTRGTGNVWTINVTDSGSPASSIPVDLLDVNKQPLKVANTGADGVVTFTDLKTGEYFASGPGAAPIAGSFTKNTRVAASMTVLSPYTWTVRTTICGRGDANDQLNLVSSANLVLKTGVTDTTGRFSFTNLASGTYKVLAPGNLSASATINGAVAPPVTTVVLPVPQGMLCVMYNPHFLHELRLAPRP